MRIRFTFIMIFIISFASARTPRVVTVLKNSSALENYKRHKWHEKHRHHTQRLARKKSLGYDKNKNLYDCFYVEAGYSKLDFKDNYFDGGTFNFGMQAGLDHITFGITTGFDFALNPARVKNALLPSPAAFNNYLFLNESFNFGFPIGNRIKFEVPLKTNLTLGKHASAEIPAYVNQYHFDQFATGLNFLARINPNVSDYNVWLGVGANYRLAYLLQDVKPGIGRNEDYSGLSYFAFLRFDFQ